MTHHTTINHDQHWSHAQCTCNWHGPDRMRWQTALDDAYKLRPQPPQLGSERMTIADNLRPLFNALKSTVGWPQSEQALIRHHPMATDDDVQHMGDCLYIEGLMHEIIDRAWESRGRLVMPPAIESAAFWADFGPWPVDHAQLLLAAWRTEAA